MLETTLICEIRTNYVGISQFRCRHQKYQRHLVRFSQFGMRHIFRNGWNLKSSIQNVKFCPAVGIWNLENSESIVAPKANLWCKTQKKLVFLRYRKRKWAVLPIFCAEEVDIQQGLLLTGTLTVALDEWDHRIPRPNSELEICAIKLSWAEVKLWRTTDWNGEICWSVEMLKPFVPS